MICTINNRNLLANGIQPQFLLSGEQPTNFQVKYNSWAKPPIPLGLAESFLLAECGNKYFVQVPSWLVLNMMTMIKSTAVSNYTALWASGPLP